MQDKLLCNENKYKGAVAEDSAAAFFIPIANIKGLTPELQFGKFLCKYVEALRVNASVV